LENGRIRQRGNRRAARLYHAYHRAQAAHHPGAVGKGQCSMSQPSLADGERLPLSLDQLIEQVCSPFEAALKATPPHRTNPHVLRIIFRQDGAQSARQSCGSWSSWKSIISVAGASRHNRRTIASAFLSWIRGG